MAKRDTSSFEARRAALVESVRNKRAGNTTALYTYLNKNLRSPRLRQMLKEGAEEHKAENEAAGGT